MTGLLAAVPLLTVLALLVLPGASVATAILSGLLLVTAVPLVSTAFAVTIDGWLTAVLAGLATTLPVAHVLLGGLVLAQVLRSGGALTRLSGALTRRLPDPVHRTLTLVLGVAVFFESVTGFGVGAVVCAPVFVALGFTPWRAAALSLLGLCAVTWGALAIGTSVGAALSGVPGETLGTLAVPLSLPFWMATGLLALRIAQVSAPVRDRILVVAGYVLILSLGLLVVGTGLSYELAGALSGLLVVGFGAWRGRSQRAAAPLAASVPPLDPAIRPLPPRAVAASGTTSEPSTRAALAPLIVLLAGLILFRMPGPVADWAATAAALELTGPGARFAPIGHPGSWMLIAAGVGLAVLPEARRGMRRQARDILANWSSAAAVVAGFLVFASLMSAAGMTAHLAGALTRWLGAGYVWLIAPIGALGGFLTGSNTGSNAMLMPIQLAGAAWAGVPADWAAAAQNAAGSNATLASPGRLVLATRLTGCAGAERRLLFALAPVIAFGTAGTAVVLVLCGRTS